ncbi:TetR/AcrR family transcriptional regulator [Alloalcanivorax xenomutans]|uniref:TetR/AcrR family transcriptional regulator n=1 Tax=Alloalcanivorax xenomutans TaxID=1094342 RepID=UPI003D9BBB73
MPPRGRPRNFDRETVLRKALDVFWRKGFEHASMADLTAAMGLNPPSLYAAFGSKEGLFREVLELYRRHGGSGIWEPVADSASAREAVAHVLRQSARAFSHEDRPPGCLIVLAAPQSEGASPAICEILREHRTRNISVLRERFERAVADGELAPGTDCQALATYLATLQHGMSILARDGADRAALMSVADTGLAAWDALVSRPPAPAPDPH